MNNIKKYRLQQGLTLKEMAQKINISNSYLCHLEKERRKNPSVYVMKNIAKLLKKEIVDIFNL